MHKPDKVRSTGKTKLGTWQLIPLARVSRYLALTGWDYVIVDLQHSSFTLETAYECIHTLLVHDVSPWVRVPVDAFQTISRLLDAGADAVVVPMVNKIDDARCAARMAKYPPLGSRSVGGDVWHHRGADYIQTANRTTRLLTQIEHIDALEAIDRIADVEGVDGLFAGPVDLAFSLGLALDGFDRDPVHTNAVRRVLDASQQRGKMACVNCSDVEDVKRRAEEGFEYISLQSDVDLLLGSGRELIAELRALLAGASLGRTPKHHAIA